MADTPQKVAKATAKAIGEEEKKPPPLSGGEVFVAILLFIAGLIVIGVTFYAFSTTDSGFTFKQSEKTVTAVAASGSKSKTSSKVKCGQKPTRKQRKLCRKKQRKQAQKGSGGSAGGAKGAAQPKAAAARTVTREVEYSDSVAIAALAIGAGLAIGGGFYRRLRSLKFAGVEASFGTDPETKKAVEEQVEQKVEQKGIEDPEKKAAVTTGAQRLAFAQLAATTASGVEPNEMIIEGIAEAATTEIAKAVKVDGG